MGRGAYAQIQEWIKAHHGITVNKFWIAHAKEICGLPLRKRNNPSARKHPCPSDRLPLIAEAFLHFGML